MRIFLMVIAGMNICHAADILMVTMGGTKSHKIPFLELARALIPRGHNITFVSGFIADISEIGLHEITPAGLVNYIHNFTNSVLVGARMRGDLPVSAWNVMRYPFEACDEMFKDAETKELLNRNFDLLILDGAFPERALGMVHVYKVPFMYINTVGFYTGSLSLAGSPSPFSVTPVFYSSFTDDMTIMQRAINAFFHTFANVCHALHREMETMLYIGQPQQPPREMTSADVQALISEIYLKHKHPFNQIRPKSKPNKQLRLNSCTTKGLPKCNTIIDGQP